MSYKKLNRITPALFGLMTGILSIGFAQADVRSEYPVPSVDHMLFYIQKSTNTNTVVYQLNLGEQGQLDRNKPIKVFWVRYQEEGQRKNLSFFERKFAYGVILKQLEEDANVFDVKLVALKSREFKLESSENGMARLVTDINGKRARLTNVFLEIEGNSFWPNIQYIDIYGLDLNTGEQIHERMSV